MGLRYGGLSEGFINVDEALQMPNGPLALFRVQPAEIFGANMPPYLPASLFAPALRNSEYMSMANRDPTSQAIDDLTAFGRYLIDHAQPPWVRGSVDPWLDSIWEDIADKDLSHLQRGSLSYFGAVITMLIAIECMEAITLPDKRRSLGPISELHPYIAQRWGIGPASKPPEVPVPQGFSQVLYDWSESKVNFVERSRTGAAKKGQVIRE
jgi:hypothetical protein